MYLEIGQKSNQEQVLPNCPKLSIGRLKKNIRNILQDFRGIKKPLSLALH